VVGVLQRDQAHPALVGDHAQALHLRHDGPVLALAGADLLVAVQADDEEVAELAGRLQVHRVALVQDVEGAAGQHDLEAQRPQRADRRLDLLVVLDEALVEVGRVREQAARYAQGLQQRGRGIVPARGASA